MTIPRTTFFLGVGAVLLLLSLRAESYVRGFFLGIPSILFGMATALLVMVLVLLFLVGSGWTIIAIVTRRAKLACLLDIVGPPAVVVLLFSLPLPDWHDTAAITLADIVSEQRLIDFARETRRTAEALQAKDPSEPGRIYEFPCPALERLPDNLRTDTILTPHQKTPRCFVFEDRVQVQYGPPRVAWGLVIADTLPDGEKFGEKEERFVLYKRLYDRVLIFSTFSSSA